MAERAPLSAAQRGLWALDQLVPGSAFYNVAAAYRVSGPLDAERLEAALRAVVERHPVLRTTIETDEGVPAAFVRPAERFSVSVDDLSATPGGRREAAALRAAAAEAARPFDLAADLPFRVRLTRLDATDHVLSLTAHHVASDESALRTVLAEATRAYASGPDSLEPVALQYAGIAAREAETLLGEDLDVLLAFWRKTLRDAPERMRLPADHPSPAVPTFKGATVRTEPGSDVVAGLERVVDRFGSSFESAVLATFAILLHRYTSDEDLVLGWSLDARTEETRSVVGTFVNVLPLRLRVRGEDSFEEVLERVDRAVEGVHRHRHLPFETLIEELRPRRGSSHAPLFQVAVAVGDERTDVPQLPGAEVTPIPLEATTAQFDLFLGVERGADGWRASLDLATDVFDPATVQALARHWINVAAAVSTTPEAPVATLPILDLDESAAIVGRADGGPAPAAIELVHEAIGRRARTSPDALAVVAPDGELTYADLDARSGAVAAALASRGIARGSVVALLAERTAALVPAMLGILRAGCAYLPLDPSYPPARLAFMVEDSGAAAVVGHAGPPELVLPPEVARIPLAGERGESPTAVVSGSDLAYVIYTSGSTGRPKGVMVEHASLARFVAAISGELGLEPSDRVLQFASLSFDTAVEEIWPTLVRGATLVSRDPHPWGPEELPGKVAEHRVTVLDLPTAYWHQVSAACADGVDVRDAESLRLVVAGGEAMSAEATRLWHASAPRDVRLLNTYGPTEATVTATSYDVAEWTGAGSVPIGRPLRGTRAYVLDARLEPVPDGVVGELHVAGSGVARGYLGRPGTTAERFLPDPWSQRAGERMYATGDLVRRRRDGVLEFAGRRDAQVKLRGFRVEPGEVEAVLSAHPGVAGAAVVVASGEVPRLAAYVVPAAEGADPPSVTSWLRDRLPEHMVPSIVAVLDALPETPGGKVDRAALAALVPDAVDREVARPGTPAEQVLASIWQKLLGVEDVGVDDSFFDLGGHSLVATQLVSRIRRAFGVSLPLRAVFESPTLSGLAAAVERAASGPELDELPLVPVTRGDAVPLSFAQQRLWFIDQFKPGSADYVIAARAVVEGPLDVPALEGALTTLAERHEALRTTFPSEGGEARQVVSSTPVAELAVHDVRRAPDPEAAAAGLVRTEAARPFDLAAGPLWRSALVRVDEDRHVFVTCMHHIVSDGWSLGVFASELSESYSARVEGRAPELPNLDVSYADFAVWQRRWFSGDELGRQLGYWKERLEGAPSVLELPTDRPRPPIQSFEGASASLTLGGSAVRDLRAGVAALARAHEVTPFMVALAAFELLLHRYTGATDVVVGSPIAGRNRAEIEGLIGFFVNTLVLRCDLAGDPTFAELLTRVREVALGAYAHQDLPFEKLVEELGIDRDLAHSPAVQVMFVYQNTPPGDLRLAGTAPARLEAPTNEVAVDLTFDLTETEEGLTAQVVYNADLFDRRTIEAFLRHYDNVLADVVADARKPLSRVEVLDREERRAILTDFNPPPTPYPDDVRVHEVFERVAQERAEAPAAVYGDETLSYRELNERANQLARHLVDHGVVRGDLVAVLLERGPDLIVSLLAILKAGGAYLPIDPEHPRRRTTFMLDDAEARVLVTAGEPPVDDAGGARVVSLDEDAGAISARERSNLGVAGDAGDLAYAIYTSGSTGIPKGICIPHRAVARLVLATDYVKLGPHAVIAQISNASFDAATFEIWGALLNGGVLAGAEKDVVLDARRFRAALEAHHADTAFVTSALFNQLVADDPSLFSTMDSVLVGGEALDPSTVRRCLAADPPARLLNAYGPTESTTFATHYRIEAVPEGATSIPIGRPIANTKVHVLDDAMNPVPVGVPGEIHVGGPGLATGYLARPGLTKERFVPDPFSEEAGARLYKTGDLGRYLPSGDVEFLGRIDSQVKIRGFRVELGEVEAALAEHPRVTEAAVTVTRAAGDKRLVAYVVGGAPLGELRRFVSERIPYYMVPSDYVELEALPLNANGKVDRRSLPAPDPARRGPAGEHVAPRDDTERKLAAIWQGLLGASEVGVHDGFFELGGHSLLATQMVSRIRDTFGVELELRAVFEAPTIARLAPRVQTAPSVAARAVPELKALSRPTSQTSPLHGSSNQAGR